MKRNNRLRCLTALILVCLLCVQVLAAGYIDLTHPVTLTLSCKDGNTPLVGMWFGLYQVADIAENGELTVKDEFSQFDIDIRGENDDAWRELATTLEGYVLWAGLTPADSGRTDADGLLTFPSSGVTLAPGLYLVIGRRHTQNGYYYDPTPFMVLLPSVDHEINDWDYDVSAVPKFDKFPIPTTPEDEDTDHKVIKIWEDEGAQARRPEAITVHLLRDGEVYDTVSLSAANNWRYEWTKLNSRYRWILAEETPEGYTVTVTQTGNTFVVTNTATEEPTPETPAGPTLPQTGQLWWPVPVLLLAGLLLVMVGLFRRKRSGNEA